MAVPSGLTRGFPRRRESNPPLEALQRRPFAARSGHGVAEAFAIGAAQAID